MPAAVRLGDACSGHGCFAPRPNCEASPNVYVEGRAWHRVGDAWLPHGCAVCPPHGGVLAAGSASVLVNGRPAGRIGDPISCGSVCAEGAATVWVG